jgi:hypothetical protein
MTADRHLNKCKECTKAKVRENLQPESKLLYVTGRGFCGGVIFEKVHDEWRICDMAPYLRKVLRGVAVGDIGRVLKEKGFKYEWL